MSWSLMEKRAMKGPKRKLGPPDYYPQRLEQKEDEMTPEKLKEGFRNLFFREAELEYPSSIFEGSRSGPRNGKLVEGLDETFAKLAASFDAAAQRRAEANVLQDRDRKAKAQHKLTNLWHASTKPAEKDKWFRDLANNRSLTALAKRFPVFKGKDEILTALADFNISMPRAAWFIKMTAISYAQNSADLAKRRNKTPVEASVEWTKVIHSYLSSLLASSAVADFYSATKAQGDFSYVAGKGQDLFGGKGGQGEGGRPDTQLRHWDYLHRLAKFMFDEGLLDRSDWLHWLIDTFAQLAFNPDKLHLFKIFLFVVHKYVREFGESELHSRRMAHLVCRKFLAIANEFPGKTPPQQYYDLLACPTHKHIILTLSSLLQAILLDCPTALVWNYLGEGGEGRGEGKAAWHCGSPLDHLPCHPSTLPLPDQDARIAANIKKLLGRMESEVVERSERVECRWSSDKSSQSALGWIVPQMLETLEELDKANVEQAAVANQLYPVVFRPGDGAEGPGEGGEEWRLGLCDVGAVKLLCHWASTHQRDGTHRPALVARLLRLRQTALQEHLGRPTPYLFQTALVEFLDTEAPVMGEASEKSHREFQSLIRLFGELIRVDLFSHDRYVSMLIARGEAPGGLEGMFSEPRAGPAFSAQTSVRSAAGDESEFPDLDASNDPHKVDIGRSLAILEGEGGSGAGTPSTPPTSLLGSSSASSAPATTVAPPSVTSLSLAPNTASFPRHQQYLLHLPVPQDPQYRHEVNQRWTLVFGFGGGREAQRAGLEKLAKEVRRVWEKKAYVKLGRDARELREKTELSGALLAGLERRFRELSFYDQDVVAGWAINGWLGRLRDWEAGEKETAPSPASLDFLLHLLHATGNSAALVDFAGELAELLVSVEERLRTFAPALLNQYTSRVGAVLVGFLRGNYAYFVHSGAEAGRFVGALARLLLPRARQGPANSTQRSIWVFLADVLNDSPDLLKGLSEAEAGLFSPGLLEAKVLPSKVRDVADRSGKWNKDKWKAAVEAARLSALTEAQIEELRKSDDARLSFALTGFHEVLAAGRSGAERLWEVCGFLADATTLVGELANEWLVALNSLCLNPVGGQGTGIAHNVAGCLDGGDAVRMMESLATLLTTLVSRSCLNQENVLAIPTQAYVNFVKQRTSGLTGKMEQGLQLTLRLIRSILCLSEAEARGLGLAEADEKGWLGGAAFGLCRLESERYLLSATQRAMHPTAILTFLMASVLASEPENLPAGLRSLAVKVLEAICAQDWLKAKFLYNDDIFSEKMLLNPKIGDKAQRLLRLITRRSCEAELVAEIAAAHSNSKRDLVEKLLGSLNVWNLRPTVLDLQLFLLRASGWTPHEMSHALDVIARSTMDVFHQQRPPPAPTAAPLRVTQVHSLWLIAPLVHRLPSNVQGKVLETAAAVLESGQLSRKPSTSSSGDNSLGGPPTPKPAGGPPQSAHLLGQEPFLCLVLTCLKGQEEQRESLLKSLLKQLRDYLERVKEEPGDLIHPSSVHQLHEAILLRLSLVGGMLQTVCRGKDLDAWGVVLIQLVFSGVANLESNTRLFFTCVDMLATILHSTAVPESGFSPSPEDNKRLYTSLVKKLKKEVGERFEPRLKLIHQLLPLPKPMVEICTTEPYGTAPTPPPSASSKSSKGSSQPPPGSPSSGPPASARQGLRMWEKQKLNPWDLVEGLKGREPWSWSWFSTQKVDWCPTPASRQLSKLISHNHYHLRTCQRAPIPGMGIKHDVMEPITNIAIDPNKQLAQQQQAQMAAAAQVAAQGGAPGPSQGGPGGPQGPGPQQGQPMSHHAPPPPLPSHPPHPQAPLQGHPSQQMPPQMPMTSQQQPPQGHPGAPQRMLSGGGPPQIQPSPHQLPPGMAPVGHVPQQMAHPGYGQPHPTHQPPHQAPPPPLAMQRQESYGGMGMSMAAAHPHMAGLMRSGSEGAGPMETEPTPPPASVRGRGKRKSATGTRGGRKAKAAAAAAATAPPPPQQVGPGPGMHGHGGPMMYEQPQQGNPYQAVGQGGPQGGPLPGQPHPQQHPPPYARAPQAGPHSSSGGTNSKAALQKLLHERGTSNQPPQQPPMDAQQHQAMMQQQYQQRQMQMQRQMSGGGRAPGPQGLAQGHPQGLPQGPPQGLPQGLPQGPPQGLPQGHPGAYGADPSQGPPGYAGQGGHMQQQPAQQYQSPYGHMGPAQGQ